MAAGPTVRAGINFHLAEVRDRQKFLGVGPSYSNLLPGPQVPANIPQWFWSPVTINAAVPNSGAVTASIPPVPPLKDYVGTASISGVYTSRPPQTTAVSSFWAPQNQVTPIQLPPADWSPYIVGSRQPLGSSATTAQNPQVIQTFVPQHWPASAGSSLQPASVSGILSPQPQPWPFVPQHWPSSAKTNLSLQTAVGITPPPPYPVQTFRPRHWASAVQTVQPTLTVTGEWRLPYPVQTFRPQQLQATAGSALRLTSATTLWHLQWNVPASPPPVIHLGWQTFSESRLPLSSATSISHQQFVVPPSPVLLRFPWMTIAESRLVLLTTTAITPQALHEITIPQGSPSAPLRVQTGTRPPTYWPGRGTIH